MALFRLTYPLILCRSPSLLLRLVSASLLSSLPAVLLLGLVVRPTLLLRRGASLGARLSLNTLLPSTLIVGSRCLIGSSLVVLATARSGVMTLPV